jgi:hypothetical protein
VSKDEMGIGAVSSSIPETPAENAAPTQNAPDILAWLVWGVVGVMTAATFGLAFAPRDAKAIPSFARQTGQPCATCHTAFPELTPFGRRFKLGGYTIGGGMSPTEAPPISAMVVPTFTKTKVQQDTPPTNANGYPIAHVNDNLILQQASLFYGGQIYGNLGAFVQGTYDKASQHTFLDAADIRYVDTHTFETKTFGNLDVLYGLNVNNGPTIQDVWNTTPAWSFPYLSSTLAPAFGPPGTQIEGGWGGRSAGTGAYLFFNDMLYVEGSVYNNLSKGQLSALGQPCGNNSNSDFLQNVAAWAAINYPSGVPFSTACPSNSLAGASPYWRVAFEPSFGNHTLEIGAFGFYPRVLPGRVMGYGVDQYRDIGFDAQYQYINDVHALTLKVTRISENQNLQATYAQGVAGQFIDNNGIVNVFGVPPKTGNGPSSNPTNSLTSFKASGSYVWDHMLSGTVGYFSVRGSPDALLYGNAILNPVSGGSATGYPDAKGLIFDFAYLPFSKGSPGAYAWANAKFGVSYTHYLKINDGWANFDGQGVYYNGSSWRTHSATDNNTLFLYSWVAF